MEGPKPGEEGMSPLEKGRRRYQQKDYPGALSAFTDAVDMSTAHLLVTALEHRAATYEKLKQLQLALRDAKRMIDLKPENSKGYLRCGKVLQLKGENELALKIYERGLKKVKIGTDDDRSLLQKMYSKLKKAQDPGKILDPLLFLPLELAVMVCENLTMRDRVICLAVSKPWKRLLESSPNLWTKLDTSYTKKNMSLKAIKVHLRRSRYTIDHAIITTRANLDAQTMTYIMKTCKKLKRLELHGHGVVGDSLTSALPLAQNLEAVFVSRSITMTSLLRVLKACKDTLLEAAFQNISHGWSFVSEQWPRLEKLEVLNLKAISDCPIYLSEIRSATPNLQSLTLHRMHFPSTESFVLWTKLRDLDLSDCDMAHLPKLPPTIRYLILRDNHHLKDGSPDVNGHTPLPLLEVLDCSGTGVTRRFITEMSLTSIKNENLKVLAMGKRMVGSRGITGEDYPSSKSVVRLSLAQLTVSEDRLLQLVSLYPNLRRLDVSATKITGIGVKTFVEKGITYLNMLNCQNVSTDAVDWARLKGLEIEFSFPK